MPESPIYKFEVHVLNADGITPDSIVRSPRIFKPQDLEAACQNTDIICSSSEPAPSVAALVHFVVIEFFVLAHRTGLYNRQKNLWESLSKVASVSVFQLKTGIFRRTPVPLYDLHFQDHRGRAFLAGHLIDPSYDDDQANFEKLLANFLGRCQKMTGMTGLILCCPAPIPQKVVAKVAKLTDAADPVGRYESLLPEPWSAPLNLLQIEQASPNADGQPASPAGRISLVHPDLTATKRIRAAVINEDKL